MSRMIQKRLSPMVEILSHAFHLEEFWKEMELSADRTTALKVTLEPKNMELL